MKQTFPHSVTLKTGLKALIVLLLICSALLTLFYLKRANRCQILGLNPLEVEVLEDHNDALQRWIEKDVRNSILVNIDAHDDIERIRPEDIEKLRAAYQQRNLSGGAKTGTAQFRDFPVTNANFIYAAAKLGIVSKVCWIVPRTYDLFSDSGDRLRSLLARYTFSREDINTFRPEGGCFRGSVDGIPFLICGPDRLPDFGEPVLLTVDVDFFPEAVSSYRYKLADSVKGTFKALFRKGYEIRDATVAYSVDGGFLPTYRRWVGDLAVDDLRRPAELSRNELLERYSILQRADLLVFMKRYEDLLNYLVPVMNERDDPSLLTYAAKASFELGWIGKAFDFAEGACLAQKNYCYGLPELGNAVLDKYGLRAAERFFRRGYELNPRMDQGQFEFGVALKKAGKYDEAIESFQVFRSIYGPYPVDFFLAEAYLKKRDKVSAQRYYDSGRAAMMTLPNAVAGLRDANAIKRAAQFDDNKGRADYSTELKSIFRASMSGKL